MACKEFSIILHRNGSKYLAYDIVYSAIHSLLISHSRQPLITEYLPFVAEWPVPIGKPLTRGNGYIRWNRMGVKGKIKSLPMIREHQANFLDLNSNILRPSWQRCQQTEVLVRPRERHNVPPSGLRKQWKPLFCPNFCHFRIRCQRFPGTWGTPCWALCLTVHTYQRTRLCEQIQVPRKPDVASCRLQIDY